MQNTNSRTILGCLLIAEELHGRVRDNTSTICAISFKQSSKTLSSPYILQTLNSTRIFYVMRILNLSKNISFPGYISSMMDNSIYMNSRRSTVAEAKKKGKSKNSLKETKHNSLDMIKRACLLRKVSVKLSKYQWNEIRECCLVQHG